MGNYYKSTRSKKSLMSGNYIRYRADDIHSNHIATQSIFKRPVKTGKSLIPISQRFRRCFFQVILLHQSYYVSCLRHDVMYYQL